MARERNRRSAAQRLFTLVGVVFILVGLGFVGYVGWQYYSTDIVSRQK